MANARWGGFPTVGMRVCARVRVLVYVHIYGSGNLARTICMLGTHSNTYLLGVGSNALSYFG